MARKVEEWIGKTPDSKPPPRVRLRIWERENGMCHISKRKIAPGELWDLDHVPALINGGQNRESMLFPALRDKHREKTKQDVAEKSAIAEVRKKHVIPRDPDAKPKLQGRPFAHKPKPEKLAVVGKTEMQRRYGL